MTGFELMIFGVGPTLGLMISLAAWLCERRYASDSYPKHHQDWI